MVCALLMFALYNILPALHPTFFNSPDELVNAAFIQEFADNTVLVITHTQEFDGVATFIHPRSTYADRHEILPVGFVGLPFFYGILAKFFAFNIVLMTTSVLAIAAVFAFRNSIARVFDTHIAFFSSLILLFHPAWWYYANRPLLPNLSFVSLLIIGTYFLFLRPLPKKKKLIGKYLNDIVGLLLIGASVFFRPSEIIWVGIVGIVLLIFTRKHIALGQLIVGGAIAAVYAFFFIGMNIALYDSPLGGYISSNALEAPSKWSFLFPFGIDISAIARSTYVYLVKMFWWLSIPSLIGVGVLLSNLAKKRTSISREQLLYVVVSAIITIWLLLYYGSYEVTLFYQQSIGVAYTRYWLPIFVLMIPFAVYAYARVLQLFSRKIMFIVLGIGLAGIIGIQTQTVLYDLNGLVPSHERYTHAEQIRTAILDHTDEDAIIVTDTEDKVVWPYRQVMVRAKDPDIGGAVANMLEKNYKMYYFGPILPRVAEEDLFAHFDTFGLELTEDLRFKNHILYQFSSKETAKE